MSNWSVEKLRPDQVQYAALDARISERVYAAAKARENRVTASTAVDGLPVELENASLVVCARGIVRAKSAWGRPIKSAKGKVVVEVTEVLVPGARSLFPGTDGQHHAMRECDETETRRRFVLWKPILLRRRSIVPESVTRVPS